MKYEIKQQILNDLAALREAEQVEAEKRRIELRKNEAFKAADTALIELTCKIAEAEAFGKDTVELKANFDRQKQDWVAALTALGATEADLEPKVRCSICDDYGLVDGVPCKCLNQMYLDRLRDICGLKYKADFKFSDCDLSVVKDENHKKKLAFLYKILKSYCDKFPNANYKNILLTGKTGVGKTCLASAVANELLEKGFMVVFITAFDFNRLMLKYHTSPFATRHIYMDDLLDCDLLIIDDLGAEQIIKNVTEEYLFLVLSSRKSNGKHTMFSTNLSLEGLKEFYGERIFSRIVDKTNTFSRYLDGDDLRVD